MTSIHDVASLIDQVTYFGTKLVTCHAWILNNYQYVPDSLFKFSLQVVFSNLHFCFSNVPLLFVSDLIFLYEIPCRFLISWKCIAINFIQEDSSENNATSFSLASLFAVLLSDGSCFLFLLQICCIWSDKAQCCALNQIIAGMYSVCRPKKYLYMYMKMFPL